MSDTMRGISDVQMGSCTVAFSGANSLVLFDALGEEFFAAFLGGPVVTGYSVPGCSMSALAIFYLPEEEVRCMLKGQRVYTSQPFRVDLESAAAAVQVPPVTKPYARSIGGTQGGATWAGRTRPSSSFSAAA